jgi:hypothetical protein
VVDGFIVRKGGGNISTQQNQVGAFLILTRLTISVVVVVGNMEFELDHKACYDYK